MYDRVAAEVTQATPPPYHRWWDCAALVVDIVFTFFDGDGGSWTDTGERLERLRRFSRVGSGGGFRTDPSFSDSLDRGLNIVVAP